MIQATYVNHGVHIHAVLREVDAGGCGALMAHVEWGLGFNEDFIIAEIFCILNDGHFGGLFLLNEDETGWHPVVLSMAGVCS